MSLQPKNSETVKVSTSECVNNRNTRAGKISDNTRKRTKEKAQKNPQKNGKRDERKKQKKYIATDTNKMNDGSTVVLNRSNSLTATKKGYNSEIDIREQNSSDDLEKLLFTSL